MKRLSFKTESIKISENSQVYSIGMQTKFFVMNFTVSELLGIPFCPWKNKLQSQPETVRWKHMQIYQNELALTGKAITKPKRSLCYLDTLRLDSFARNRQGFLRCWSVSGILEDPVCGSLGSLHEFPLRGIFFFFFFWLLFYSLDHFNTSRRVGEAKRDDIIIPLFFLVVFMIRGFRGKSTKYHSWNQGFE